MFEKEYILRVVKACVQTAVAIFAGKHNVKSDVYVDDDNLVFSEDELLEFVIRKYLSDGKINEAENLIFEATTTRKTSKNLETALLFYKEIDSWEENKLLKCNFSKLEIQQGMSDLRKLYGE